MKFRLALFSLALATASTAVYAQLPTLCVLECLGTAGREAGCGTLDISCMCTSEKFRADMHTCLQAECTPADQLVADQLDAKFCGTQS